MAKKLYNPNWESYWRLWQKVGPPWLTPIQDIKFWEKRILEIKKKDKKIKALVLGATPKIRDLLAKHKIDTTLLEANKSMYVAMSRLIKIKNNEEKFICGDWLNADKIFKKNTFDFIIGDEPHCNLSFKNWPKFFQGIYNILKPNFNFLLSTVISDFSDRSTIKEVIQKYKDNPKYFKDFKNRLWELYKLIGEKNIYNKKTRGFIFDNLRDLVKKEGLKSGLSLNQIEKNLWFIDNDMNSESIGSYIEVDPPLEEQIIIQSKYFYLDKIFKVDSHPAFNIRRAMILKSKKLK
ncbi:class I SAM-dependent methyltransferase [Candidatus Parcubacteria bacterium]|nr:class I SAM-dependent methyltransferase [Candidatus Parcubacteria bacterium]